MNHGKYRSGRKVLHYLICFSFLLLTAMNSVTHTNASQEDLSKFGDPNIWKKLANKKIQIFKHSKVFNARKPPKNVILFIGDGMSMNTVTASRYMKAAKMKKLGGEVNLVWDEWPVSTLVRTVNLDRLTTDSGSSATAFLCGAKSAQRNIGLTGSSRCCECKNMNEFRKVYSSFFWAAKAGLATGIVTTTRVTHATPAAAYAHTPERNWESSSNGSECTDIATQLIENGIDFNVVMGGGLREFYGSDSSFDKIGKRTDTKNLLHEWSAIQSKKNRSHIIIYNRTSLQQLDLNKYNYVMGLYAYDHLHYRLENKTNEPSLTEMLEATISILSRNPKGYLLLVEGGRIDHGHHNNTAFRALDETLALEDAVQRATQLVNVKDTLLIVTADHSHAYGLVGYATRKTSVLAEDNTQKGLDNHSYLLSTYFNGPGAELNASRPDPLTKGDIFDSTYAQQALVKLDSATHSSEDVGLYANGPFKELFNSACDNTFIAYVTMFSLCLGDYAKESHCQTSTSSQAVYLASNSLILLCLFTYFTYTYKISY